MMEPSYFEDYAVGQRFRLAPWTVDPQDLARFGQAAGSAAPPGAFGEAALLETKLLETNWRYLVDVDGGDTLRGEATITACRRSPSGADGVVNRHVAVYDQDDTLVQEGTCAVRVPARGSGPDPVTHDFGSQPWGQALADVVADDAEFASATATWDGTIALRSGEREVHLRIYRGSVIEVSRRAPLGATFTFGADEITWTDLITGETNDFMRRAMAGEFDVRGNGYEYLRLTKVVNLLVEGARSLAAGGGKG